MLKFTDPNTRVALEMLHLTPSLLWPEIVRSLMATAWISTKCFPFSTLP